MPHSCVAYGCTNLSNKPDCLKRKVSYHRFPLDDPIRLAQWLLKIRRANFTPTYYSRICSDHFEDDCFDVLARPGKKMMKKDAIPTKFNFHATNRFKRKKLSDKKECSSMVMCIVPGCHHYNQKHLCRFFRIPADKKVQNIWVRNIGRKDKELNTKHFVCQCHFKDGRRDNGPTIFPQNKDEKISPKRTRKRKKPEESSDLSPESKFKSDVNLSKVPSVAKQVNIKIPLVSNSNMKIPSVSNSIVKISPVSNSDNIGFKMISDSISSIKVPSDSHTNIKIESCSRLSTDLQNGDKPQPDSNLPSNLLSNVEAVYDSHSNDELSREDPDTGEGLSSSSTESSDSLLKIENELLRKELAQLQEENSKLREFGFFAIQDHDNLIAYYTGVQKKTVFDLILTVCTSSPLVYCDSPSVEMLPPEDQLLLTLMKLKLNSDYIDLGVRFNTSTETASNAFLMWLNVLHEKLYKPLVNIILSNTKDMVNLSLCYNNFKHCRMVICCAEFFISRPKNLLDRRNFYSSYKRRPTLKCLVGVSQSGAVTYCSELFPGSKTDEEVFKHGCLQCTFQPGDLLLYEGEGYLITDDSPLSVDDNTPPFLSTYHFASKLIENTTNIERARLHVENAVQLIKAYKIVRSMPYTLFPHSTKILQSLVALSNFQP